MFHKEDNILQLDLLLVGKEYKRHGIGTKLIKIALECFADATFCIVYPLRFGNNETLKFYESLGFINCGFGPENKLNSYGVSYDKMHFFYKMDTCIKRTQNNMNSTKWKIFR